MKNQDFDKHLEVSFDKIQRQFIQVCNSPADSPTRGAVVQKGSCLKQIIITFVNVF